MVGEFAVGRIRARRFVVDFPNFTRTSNRQDFSVLPPKKTMLDYLTEEGLDTPSVGKIFDIFAGKGISQSVSALNNADAMAKTMRMLETDFCGLCFINLVDFDALYGHRNDVDGYAKALAKADESLADFIADMGEKDLLLLTADHGCDPGTPSTAHSSEYVHILAYGPALKENINLGTRQSFADIAATVPDIFGIENDLPGQSFWNEIK